MLLCFHHCAYCMYSMCIGENKFLVCVSTYLANKADSDQPALTTQKLHIQPQSCWHVLKLSGLQLLCLWEKMLQNEQLRKYYMLTPSLILFIFFFSTTSNQNEIVILVYFYIIASLLWGLRTDVFPQHDVVHYGQTFPVWSPLTQHYSISLLCFSTSKWYSCLN